MTNIKNYLVNLLSTKNIERIVDSNNMDDISINILNYISINPNSPTNDCYMYLNDTPSAPISYEDVNLRIQNLIELGLIQNVKNLDIQYYSISSAGLFYLFFRIPDYLGLDTILENKEDGLIVNFLYPVLDFETLKKIKDIRTIIPIIQFLGKCCKTVQKVLEDLRIIQEKGGLSDSIGYVHGLADPKHDDGFYGPRGFIQGLKNVLKIEWLNPDNIKIIELKKNKLFKIYDEEKENELFLEICPERNVAVLLDNKNHDIREFYLEKTPYPEDYAIRHFYAITVEDYIDELLANDKFYLYPEIDKYESELCEELLVHMHSTYPIMNKEARMIQRQGCIAIAKDKTFQGLAMSFKQKIEFCYDNFIRLSQAS